MSRRSIFNIFLAAALFAGNLYAQTNADKEVGILSDEGYSLAKEGKFKEAIAKFESAYELKKVPVLLFNIARCHEKMGEIERAIEFYRKYADEESDAAEREKALDKIKELDEKLHGYLEVHVNEKEAEVVVDGESAGKSPIKKKLRLFKGRHFLEVSKEGFSPYKRDFLIEGEDKLNFVVNLMPIPPKVTVVQADMKKIPDAVKEEKTQQPGEKKKSGWGIGATVDTGPAILTYARSGEWSAHRSIADELVWRFDTTLGMTYTYENGDNILLGISLFNYFSSSGHALGVGVPRYKWTKGYWSFSAGLSFPLDESFDIGMHL